VQAHSDSREQFNLAFRTGSLRLIENAARALPVVSLDDALRILVAMAEKRDERYLRAAARWTERSIAECHLDLAGVQRAVTLLAELPEQVSAADVLRRELGLRRL
jgi:hypothetical protein